MKEEHNIILILDSPKWLILYSGGSSNSWFKLFHLFFSGVPCFPHYIITKIHLNHCKASTLFFLSFISFVHSFLTGVLHGGSTWWLIEDSISSRSVHWDSFQRTSSILHLASQSPLRSILSFEVVLCHCW